MGFISSTQIGTLIYETIQKELYTYQETVSHALEDLVIAQEDIELITQDLINASNQHRSSKENLINYFAYEAIHTPKIVKKYIVFANQNSSINNGVNF